MAGRNEEWKREETERDPAEIRAGIRETRERVGDTLEAIGERLNPHHVKSQVRDNIRDATVGRVQAMASNAADRMNETRYTLMDTIRENPIPALMAGVGLGWLAVNARRHGAAYRGFGAMEYDTRYAESRYVHGAYPADYGEADFGAGTVAGTVAGAGDVGLGSRVRGGMASGSVGGMMSESGEGEPGVMERAREGAGELGRNVRDTAGQLADRTRHVASDVAGRAGHVASTVSMRTRRQARRAEDRFYEMPLAFGAATFALGLAAGLAAPVTDREVRLMGDARDRVADQARELASETKEKVQHVAERVVDEATTTAKEAAREEGLRG